MVLSRKKIYLVIFVIFVTAFLAANFDYPKYWNGGADWVNQKLDEVKIEKPKLVEGVGILNNVLDKIGSTRIPYFGDRPFKLGLDLQGGVHLIYEADLSDIEKKDWGDSMQGLRDIMERRVNLFGVREPSVQTQEVGGSHRLIVELAGISDPKEAIKAIGQMPFLEFKELRPKEEQIAILKEILPDLGDQPTKTICDVPNPQNLFIIIREFGRDPCFMATGLTGKYLNKAEVGFDQQTNQPQVLLEFNSGGAEIFKDLTTRNVGRPLAIYLDGTPLSIPNVNEAIVGGSAQITGDFTLKQVKDLVLNLNAGALPVPINLISQQTIGPSLGQESLQKSLMAGIFGILAVALFMILVYRLSGILAVISLSVYVIFLLSLFKLIPVTLTLSGIAGFLLSVGIAVDANVLIFERMREELRGGKSFGGSVDEGFARAWPAIRDGNITTLLICGILFWFGSGFVQGFALVLGLGILISLFSAIFITKNLLRLFIGSRLSGIRWIWSR